MILSRFLIAAIAIFAMPSISQVNTQPGGDDRPDRPPPHPICEAVDRDGDEQISSRELRDAAKNLKSLDRDGDGQVSREELHQNRGHTGPNAHRRGGAGESNSLERLMQLDKNNDGVLSGVEIPKQFSEMAKKFDSNEDGQLDDLELEEMAQQQQTRPNGPRNGEPDAGRRGRGNDGPGGRRGPGHPAFGDPEQGRAGGQGAKQLVAQAMQFDTDGNGELNQQELTAFAQQLGPPPGSNRSGQQRGRPPGRGRPGR